MTDEGVIGFIDFSRELAFKHRKDTLLEKMKECGYTSAVAEYDGSGDDGQFTNWAFRWGHEEVSEESITATLPVSRDISFWNEEHFAWSKDNRTVDTPLLEAWHELCDDWLSYHFSGWENCEGAYGEIVLDVESGKMSMDHNVRVTEIESESREL